MYLKGETGVHVGGNHQTDGIEGVGKHLIQGHIPGSGRGLVGHKNDDRLRLALLKLHLSYPGTHPLDVAGEGIRQEVLPGTVELEGLRQLSALNEGIPGHLMNRFVLLTLLVRHNKLQVIATLGNVIVNQ